jgi:hypothetical protein
MNDNEEVVVQWLALAMLATVKSSMATVLRIYVPPHN